jgi:protein Mpv17
MGRGAHAAIARAFELYPQLANGATGFVTFSCGDLLSQKMFGEANEIDKTRAMCTGLLGVGMNGLVLHNWYRSLDFVFGSSMKSKMGVFAKASMDQLIYAPFSIIVFFAYANYLEEKSFKFESLASKVENSLIQTWLADCSFWPFVNVINFRYIPLNYRPTFVGGAQLMWQTYMSSVSHSRSKREDRSCELVETTNDVTDKKM